MPLGFPLAISQFFGELPIQSCVLDLPDATVQSGRTSGGEVLTARSGSRLWTGRVTLKPVLHSEADQIMARISVLREPGRHLFAHGFPTCSPAYDRDGSILGGAAVTIQALAANNRELRLAGLPAGYRLRSGEALAFAYGSNPVRYAFHRIVTLESVAAANGQTPLIEVTPHIRPGAAVGAAVTLIKPFFKALVVPGSVNPGSPSGRFVTGISFDILQALR